MGIPKFLVFVEAYVPMSDFLQALSLRSSRTRDAPTKLRKRLGTRLEYAVGTVQ